MSRGHHILPPQRCVSGHSRSVSCATHICDFIFQHTFEHLSLHSRVSASRNPSAVQISPDTCCDADFIEMWLQCSHGSIHCPISLHTSEQGLPFSSVVTRLTGQVDAVVAMGSRHRPPPSPRLWHDASILCTLLLCCTAARIRMLTSRERVSVYRDVTVGMAHTTNVGCGSSLRWRHLSAHQHANISCALACSSTVMHASIQYYCNLIFKSATSFNALSCEFIKQLTPHHWMLCPPITSESNIARSGPNTTECVSEPSDCVRRP